MIDETIVGPEQEKRQPEDCEIEFNEPETVLDKNVCSETEGESLAVADDDEEDLIEEIVNKSSEIEDVEETEQNSDQEEMEEEEEEGLFDFFILINFFFGKIRMKTIFR